MINGIINVYKEKGFTSHDVVAKLRGILHQKKIGHTGTLDPDAVGVLPVCLGRGTKLCDMLTDKDKVYEAVMLLGTETDTQDITGTVLAQKKITVDEPSIMNAIQSFVGEYNQLPPMYSAIKVNGKKLYELAREGKEIERKPRIVEIKSIHVNEINFNEPDKTVTFTVECSKGTYIRTLCHDIGEKLGCGACMKSLKRTRVGKFLLNDSITLSQIEQLVMDNNLKEKLLSVDSMFLDYRKVNIKEEFEKALYNGNMLAKESIADISIDESNPIFDYEMLRVYDCREQFIGIYKFLDNNLKLVKMFYDREDN